MRSPKPILLVALAVLLIAPGCALANLIVPQPTPSPVVQRALRPTFTPTPTRLAPTPAESQPAQELAAQQPAPQPTATATVADTGQAAAEQPVAAPPPTPTPQPATPTPPPTLTPTPFIVVQGDTVRVRSGPGLTYPQLGELAGGDQLTILAKSADDAWWQVCCLDDQEVWVFGDLVTVEGSVAGVAVAANVAPSPTPTATPEPKPYAIVQNPRVNVRTGPGLEFSVIGQAEQGDRLEIVGRNRAADWWQVCCIGDRQGWIIGRLVNTEGPIQQVALAPNLPTPAPVQAAAAPTATATPEPAYLFDQAEVETFPFSNNNYFRVGVKARDSENNPVGGYYLRVRNDTTGQEWLSRESGAYAWEYSAPNADFGDFRQVNIQFDTNGMSPLAGNSFLAWLVDGGGAQVSPLVRYEQNGDELQWLYAVFTRK